MFERAEIGRRLKNLRIESGKTAVEVSREINLPYKTYSQYENGYYYPPYERQVMIAKYYNLPISEIFGRKSATVSHRYSDETRRKAIETAEKVGISKTSKEFGMSKQTIRNWMEQAKALTCEESETQLNATEVPEIASKNDTTATFDVEWENLILREALSILLKKGR